MCKGYQKDHEEMYQNNMYKIYIFKKFEGQSNREPSIH